MEVACGTFGDSARQGMCSCSRDLSSLFEVPDVVLTDGSYYDTNNCEFRQLFQEAPVLEGFYLSWEKVFNALPFCNFAAQYMDWALAICIVYMIVIFGLKGYMEDKQPVGGLLRKALVVWNLFLSLFSAIGFLRTAPHLLYYLWDKGFYNSVCSPAEPAYGHGAAGFWTMLFIYSKVLELGDTLFIVLMKNKLIFLHWYHHVTVLLYCWHSYGTRSSAGLYFIAMNYGVHALMYYYYFILASSGSSKKALPAAAAAAAAAGKEEVAAAAPASSSEGGKEAAAKEAVAAALASKGGKEAAAGSSERKKPSWAGLVTTLQISQMFVGMFICASVWYFQRVEGMACDITPENYTAGLIMYASYAALFLAFAFDRYVLGGCKKPAPPAAGADAGEKKQQ